MTTNTQGAAIARYKIGYPSDKWGMRGSSPSTVPDAVGPLVTYADHISRTREAEATHLRELAAYRLTVENLEREIAAQQPKDFSDVIAMQRGEAERDLRSEKQTTSRLVGELNAENGPAYMGEPAAQQGVAYAALPTSSHAGRVYEEGFLIGTCPLYTADKLRAFADATCALRASHGQASAAPKGDIDE